MENYFIIHGSFGSPFGNWFSWLQATIIHTIILNVFFISLPLVIISLIFMKQIMIFIGNDPIIYDVGKGYYIAIMIGFIFSSFNNIFAFLSRSVCEAKRTLYMESFAKVNNKECFNYNSYSSICSKY